MSTKQPQRKRSAPDGAEKLSNGTKGSYWSAKAGSAPDKRFRPTKPRPKFTSKGKAPAKEPIETKEVEVRRKRPVTQGGGNDVEDDVDMSDEDEEEESAGVVVDGDAPPEKLPRLSRAEKAALHAAQPHRTALLPSHPLLHDTLLPLWETARRADLGKEERKVAVNELWEAVKGRVGEVSRGHKGGRVLQTVS